MHSPALPAMLAASQEAERLAETIRDMRGVISDQAAEITRHEATIEALKAEVKRLNKLLVLGGVNQRSRVWGDLRTKPKKPKHIPA